MGSHLRPRSFTNTDFLSTISCLFETLNRSEELSLLSDLPFSPVGFRCFPPQKMCQGKRSENGVDQGERVCDNCHDDKVDPGKPAALTWQRKIDSESNVPVEFNMSFQEKLHLAPTGIRLWRYIRAEAGKGKNTFPNISKHENPKVVEIKRFSKALPVDINGYDFKSLFNENIISVLDLMFKQIE
ncbi:hypothetical protein SAY86_025334 [Trapa natans]|uniref:Uncharacterized protein n=1 Tax=Trapa natans TaxID=22666 RepID=A0AAN7RC98_TRANT|nr:hypothetical protein SAY86_025334 [Trapa natans]